MQPIFSSRIKGVNFFLKGGNLFPQNFSESFMAKNLAPNIFDCIMWKRNLRFKKALIMERILWMNNQSFPTFWFLPKLLDIYQQLKIHGENAVWSLACMMNWNLILENIFSSTIWSCHLMALIQISLLFMAFIYSHVKIHIKHTN